MRLTLLVAMLAGCQVVAGVETRGIDPIKTGCTLPTDGAGKLRLANLVTGPAKVDFCIRANSAGGLGAWGRPVLRDGGDTCPVGFGYEDVTALFGARVGAIDVKAIPSGLTCAAPALSEIDGAVVPADVALTVARVGGPSVPEQLIAVPETTGTGFNAIKIRFVNALVGVPALDFGATDGPRLPAKLTAKLIADPIPFGKAITSASKAVGGTVDPSGYFVITSSAFQVGAAPSGDTKALLVQPIPAVGGQNSLFAVGDTSNPAYPPRGLYCDDLATSTKSPILDQCAETQLAVLSFDVFNATLYGEDADFERQRLPYITDAIAKRQSDVMCLTEVDRPEHQQAVLAAAKASGNFPYSVTLQTDASALPTDPRDQSGNTPPPPAAPPCAKSDPATIDAFMSCLTNKCGAVPGMPNGQLPSDGAAAASCISQSCAAQALPLYGGARDDNACFDCLVIHAVSDEKFDDTKTMCTTQTTTPWAFGGATPSMVVSRFPIVSHDTYVLPAYLWRRVVHYAQLQLEGGPVVDYYCAHISSPDLGSSLPYAGSYSNGDDLNGWRNEQLLQVQRLTDWIKAKSGARPTIIAGDWHASVAQYIRDAMGASTQVTDASDPAVYQTLGASFGLALPQTFTPSCTYCPRSINSYNGEGITNSLAWLNVFLYNLPTSSTTDASLFFDQPVVPLPPPRNGTGMLSATFGWNVQIERPVSQ